MGPTRTGTGPRIIRRHPRTHVSRSLGKSGSGAPHSPPYHAVWERGIHLLVRSLSFKGGGGGMNMVSITWHTRNTWEYTGKKGGFGRMGYVACTGGYECIMHNACIGGLGNTSSLPIVMVNVVFETTPFWALGVYGRILKAPIPQYTAVYSSVYGRILRSIRPYTWSIRPYTGGICLHHVVVSS